MTDREKKTRHTPPEKQGMKHLLDDNDNTDNNKKLRKERDAIAEWPERDARSGLPKDDIYIINDEKFVMKQHYTNIKQWLDLAKEMINEQKVIIKNFEKSVSAQQKDRIKFLINKREKFVQKIKEVDEEIRAIERDINEDDESKEGDE